jgi:DNA-binding Xre family transcriptional regulator
MTTVNFLDEITINAVVRDGETFTLKTLAPVPKADQQDYSLLLAHYFEKRFSAHKTEMLYWVLMDMQGNHGFSFFGAGSDRSEERKRIGARIRQIREEKGIEAKKLAALANIDAANLSRIEQGKYSVGLDILTKIGDVLEVKVDLV